MRPVAVERLPLQGDGWVRANPALQEYDCSGGRISILSGRRRMMRKLFAYAVPLFLIMVWSASSEGSEIYQVTVEIPGLAAPC
jgi:hypothetical protein